MRGFCPVALSPPGGVRIKASASFGLRGAAISLAGAFALLGCFRSNFLAYDDPEHIASPAYAHAAGVWDYFVPQFNTTYMPYTFLSYKVDRWLHAGWAEKLFGSWAPGVRLDSLLLHAGAALFLWRLLARLRFSETRAFFIALIFAAHPLACETLCWVSERKNTLCALFGFAALWVLADPRRPFWRWPAVCLLYAQALLGKPSALNLLPIIALLEFVFIFPAARARFFDSDLESSAKKESWIGSAVGLAVLCAISAAFLRANLFTHSGDIGTPPGGTVFTALLTDLEIFSRYIFNLVCPVHLSAMYYVEPIRGIGDARVALYGAFLIGTLAATIFFARNRWRCAFGWFWFFAALATNSNVIALVHWMQDRYVYLATPGFLIAVSEAAAGLIARVPQVEARRTIAFALGVAFAIVCASISAARGSVWSSKYALAADAVQKEPQSFYARYALCSVLNPNYCGAPRGSPKFEHFQQAWRNQGVAALTVCPDAARFAFKQLLAMQLGEDAYASTDAKAAAYFFEIGAKPSAEAADLPDAHSVSLAYLARLDLASNPPRPEAALDKAREALRLIPNDFARLSVAEAAMAYAEKNPALKNALWAEARKALDAVTAPRDAGMGLRADELLKRIGQ